MNDEWRGLEIINSTVNCDSSVVHSSNSSLYCMYVSRVHVPEVGGDSSTRLIRFDSIRLIHSFFIFVQHGEHRARLIDIICERVYYQVLVVRCTLVVHGKSLVQEAGSLWARSLRSFSCSGIEWRLLLTNWYDHVPLVYISWSIFHSNCVRRYIDKYQWALNNCHKDSKKWLCQYRAHTKRKLKN